MKTKLEINFEKRRHRRKEKRVCKKTRVQKRSHKRVEEGAKLWV